MPRAMRGFVRRAGGGVRCRRGGDIAAPLDKVPQSCAVR